MVSRYLRSIAILAILQLGSQSELAYAQGQALREMHHAMWTSSDGAPQGITEMRQHPDGTLWIASEDGLFNFDGQTFYRFQSPPDEPEFFAGAVSSLLITKTGTLWVGGYEAGVARISDGHVTVFSLADGEPFIAPYQLREAPDGSVWVVDRRRLIRFDLKGTVTREPTPSSSPIAGLFVDSSGTLWLVQDGFLHRRPLAHASYTATRVRADVVTDVAEAPTGDIWICDYDATTSLGRVQHVSSAGELVRILPQPLLKSGRLTFARDGSLILASSTDGVRRIPADDASVRIDRPAIAGSDVFRKEHGLSSDATGAVFVDMQGNIWVGGLRGFDRLRPTQLTHFMPSVEATGWTVCASTRGEVWVANVLGALYSVSGQTTTHFPGIDAPLYSLACADGGHAWFANGRGVWAVNSGTISALPAIVGARPKAFVKVSAASDHTVYATVAGGLDDGGGVWVFKGDRWTKLPHIDELGVAGRSAYIDRSDRLWVGHTKGRSALHSAGGHRTFTSGAPGLGSTFAFLDTSRGLFAGGTNGLAVLRASQFAMLAFADASLVRGVRGVVEARNGDLWLNAARGFVHVSANELAAGLADPMYRMTARLISEGDFAGTPQSAGQYLDTAARDSQGRLWFATRSGVVHLDPARASAASRSPLVSVRSMIADGQPIDSRRVLAPATRTLQIQYFGVDLAAPEKVIYRYRLRGFDESWQEAGRRTEATYTRLPAGSYTFDVMASSNDGTWTVPVSSASFTVLRPFYQTWPFGAAIIVFAVMIVGSIHLARVRHLARVMSARFDERLAERTRVARDLHDTLLQTVHGSKLVTDRALRDVTDQASLVRALEQLSVWLGQAAAEGRAALQALRASTTETNNLAAAFRRALDECRSKSTGEVSLSARGEARELHPVVRDEAYRIGYEAIRNACVHSQASRIEVALDYGHDLVVRIRDNGVGVEPETLEKGKDGHFGLRGMRERAERIGAHFTLVSGMGTGTVVTLIVPGRIAFRPA